MHILKAWDLLVDIVFIYADTRGSYSNAGAALAAQANNHAFGRGSSPSSNPTQSKYGPDKSKFIMGNNEDFIMQYNALKVKGDIFLEFKDFKQALHAYKKLKNFCDDKKRYKEKIVCYGQIGQVYTI